MNEITIGNRIASRRKEKCLSQSQLAKMLAISPQAVSKWEQGNSMPDIITLNRIAEVLEVDMNYFSKSAETIESEKISQESQKPNWNMSGGVWRNADFSGLDNLGKKFSGSHITNCHFIGSNLASLKIGGNHIKNNDFSKSDMVTSQIKGGHLMKNNFTECNMTETLISGNHIKDCNFSNANLTGAVFKGNHIIKCMMTNTVWYRTTFKGDHFNGIIFNGTFTDCVFEGCGFVKTTFQNAVFTNCFFKNNHGTRKIQFENCKADNITYAFLKNDKASVNDTMLQEPK